MKGKTTPPGGGDYEVGYGKPPLATRFKKGQPTANPKGRPKKVRKTSVQAVLDQQVNVVENGRRSRRTLEEMTHRAQAAKAAKGDTRAYNAIMRRQAAEQASLPALTAEDIRREEAEAEERKRLSDKIVGFLQEHASMKKHNASVSREDLQWIRVTRLLRSSERQKLKVIRPDLLQLAETLDQLVREASPAAAAK